MSLAQISEVVDEIVQKAIHEKLTKYAQHISYKWDIKLSLLMQDLENLENLSASPREAPHKLKNGICKGILPSGRRCSFRSNQDGYCSKHISQKKIERPTTNYAMSTTELKHNHLLSECLTKIGCPACEKSKRVASKENLLIDL